jgi:hypothetical protein
LARSQASTCRKQNETEAWRISVAKGRADHKRKATQSSSEGQRASRDNREARRLCKSCTNRTNPFEPGEHASPFQPRHASPQQPPRHGPALASLAAAAATRFAGSRIVGKLSQRLRNHEDPAQTRMRRQTAARGERIARQ